MRYRFFDGYEFEANNPMEVAIALWKSKFIPEPTLEEWMVGFVNRMEMWDGVVLPTDSVDALVDGLLTGGYLEVIS